MAKNVTIKLDEELLKLCRHEAVEHAKSLSQWVADVLAEQVKDIEAYQNARERAKSRIVSGMHLGGRPVSREELHERSSR